MKKTTLLTASLLLFCSVIPQLQGGGKKGSFDADWGSLSKYECPEWFQNAKFGIYAHWGPYSASMAPGSTNSDWYGRNMYRPEHANHQHHLDTYGSVKEFGYKDLIPLFTAEKFDADEWADLYVESGAQFAGPVGEHADGFAMWDSKVNPWNAVNMGPKRDIVAEMSKAVRARGMKFVVSMHHQWLWGWYPTWDENTDCADPKFASFYGPRLPATARGIKDKNGRFQNLVVNPLPSEEFERVWLEKVREVVEGYSPDLLWFDNRMQIISEKTRAEMAAMYYNHAAKKGQEVVLTYKRPDFPLGTATIDLERSRMPDIYPEPWLTDTSVSRSSWAFTVGLDLYTTDRCIDDLVDIVSKNGCLLLNVAPHPNGTIPENQKQILREMGAWLKLNGEAIYDSRPWLIFGEGPGKTPVGHLADVHFHGFGNKDVRFTTKGDQLYAIALGWPEDGILEISALSDSRYNTDFTSIELLGHDGILKFEKTDEALVVHFPKEKPCKYAFVLKLNR